MNTMMTTMMMMTPRPNCSIEGLVHEHDDNDDDNNDNDEHDENYDDDDDDYST